MAWKQFHWPVILSASFSIRYWCRSGDLHLRVEIGAFHSEAVVETHSDSAVW